MEKRKALVFGATGLVGKSLTEQLILSERYSAITIFTRRPAGLNSEKVTEVISDLSDISGIKQNLNGDDLYICIGTTIKKAGSVRAMEATDRDLPVSIATAARENGVKRVAVVSSIGASEQSSNYYLRIKGEMEKGIEGARFDHTVIVRPSILFGNRAEKRGGERVGIVFMKLFGPLLPGSLKKYRGIEAEAVAKGMILLLSQGSGTEIVESDKLAQIAEKG